MSRFPFLGRPHWDTAKQYVIQVKGSSVRICNADGSVLTGGELVEIVRKVSALKPAYLYLAYGYVPRLNRWCHKIGLSVNPDARLAGLDMKCLHLITTTYESRHFHEQLLHSAFIDRLRWLGGEYFNLTTPDVEEIKSITDSRSISQLFGFSTSRAWMDYLGVTRGELKKRHDFVLQQGATKIDEFPKLWKVERERQIEMIRRKQQCGETLTTAEQFKIGRLVRGDVVL